MFDLPRPHRDNPPLRKRTKEETTLEEKKKGKCVWSMSGDFIYRDHEVHRSTLYVTKKGNIPYSSEIRRRDEADADKHRQRL